MPQTNDSSIDLLTNNDPKSENSMTVTLSGLLHSDDSETEAQTQEEESGSYESSTAEIIDLSSTQEINGSIHFDPRVSTTIKIVSGEDIMEVKVDLKDDTDNPWGVTFNLKDKYDTWTVQEVVDGFQADKEGIEPGWKLVKVGDQPITEKNAQKIKKKLQQGIGCKVTFQKVTDFCCSSDSPTWIADESEESEDYSINKIYCAIIALIFLLGCIMYLSYQFESVTNTSKVESGDTTKLNNAENIDVTDAVNKFSDYIRTYTQTETFQNIIKDKADEPTIRKEIENYAANFQIDDSRISQNVDAMREFNEKKKEIIKQLMEEIVAKSTQTKYRKQKEQQKHKEEKQMLEEKRMENDIKELKKNLINQMNDEETQKLIINNTEKAENLGDEISKELKNFAETFKPKSSDPIYTQKFNSEKEAVLAQLADKLNIDAKYANAFSTKKLSKQLDEFRKAVKKEFDDQQKINEIIQTVLESKAETSCIELLKKKIQHNASTFQFDEDVTLNKQFQDTVNEVCQSLDQKYAAESTLEILKTFNNEVMQSIINCDATQDSFIFQITMNVEKVMKEKGMDSFKYEQRYNIIK